MGEPIRVLVIDDEQVIRDGCERALAEGGYEVVKAENGSRGVALMEDGAFDVVLLDLMMPGIDGFEVLSWVKTHRPLTQVIVITGYATVSKAVSAMRQGAFDFVGKPFTPDYIRIVVKRAVEKRALEAETLKLREEKALDLATIAAEQSRLKAVFGGMVEAVLVTDRDGVVVHHNPAAVKVLEIHTDPVVGKPIGASIRDPDAVRMVEEAVEKGSVVTREFPPGTASRSFLRAHCAPVRTAGGTIVGSVTVFEDITAHKKIDELKSEFVAMVAHELRAPLASIEQMIYSLRGECDLEKSARCSHMHMRITARTKDLLQLIENLLSLSKLESGTVQFSLEPCKGDEILKEVIEIVGPQAQGKNIELVFEPSPEEWWFNVDHDHIRGAFMNIIGNAIKYTPANGRVVVSSASTAVLGTVRVADTGIGIARENLPHIFDRFFRVGGKDTRGIPGSGLGLSVVKKVLEAHKGYIDVVSEPQRGTTFTLSFPLATPAMPGDN